MVAPMARDRVSTQAEGPARRFQRVFAVSEGAVDRELQPGQRHAGSGAHAVEAGARGADSQFLGEVPQAGR